MGAVAQDDSPGVPSAMPVLSVVIPVYNEEASLPDLYVALLDGLKEVTEPWEIILVDDGSQDRSFPILRDLHQRDPRVHVIRFRRNFGQTAAFVAGFEHARGAVIVTMDADLQNDPHDIPMMLQVMREGEYDVVCGWRKDRQDALLTRKIPSQVANWLISRLTGVRLHDYGCSLKAYTSEVAKSVQLYGELHRFVPALASWMGTRLVEVPVQHHARAQGKSKYNLTRVTRVLFDLITVSLLLSYGARPMQIFGKWGLVTVAAGLVASVAVVVHSITRPSSMLVPLLTWSLPVVFLGAQFFMLGLLGEFLTRIYFETQHKPIYVVREILDATGPGR